MNDEFSSAMVQNQSAQTQVDFCFFKRKNVFFNLIGLNIHHSSFIIHHSSFIIHHSSFIIPTPLAFAKELGMHHQQPKRFAVFLACFGMMRAMGPEDSPRVKAV